MEIDVNSFEALVNLGAVQQVYISLFLFTHLLFPHLGLSINDCLYKHEFLWVAATMCVSFLTGKISTASQGFDSVSFRCRCCSELLGTCLAGQVGSSVCLIVDLVPPAAFSFVLCLMLIIWYLRKACDCFLFVSLNNKWLNLPDYIGKMLLPLLLDLYWF